MVITVYQRILHRTTHRISDSRRERVPDLPVNGGLLAIKGPFIRKPCTRATKGGTLRNPADTRVFDHPSRSERGWVRTQAFRWELEDRNALERVKDGDDAVQAIWGPVQDIHPEMMFEDHFDIIQSMITGTGFSYPLALYRGFPRS